MKPEVTVAVIEAAGGLLYLACYVLAIQTIYAVMIREDAEKAWVVMGWRLVSKWWSESAELRKIPPAFRQSKTVEEPPYQAEAS